MGRSQKCIWSTGVLSVHSPFQPPKQRSSVSGSGKLSLQRQCLLSGPSPAVGVLPDVGLRSALVQFPPIVPSCTPFFLLHNKSAFRRKAVVRVEGRSCGETEQVSWTLGLLCWEMVIMDRPDHSGFGELGKYGQDVRASPSKVQKSKKLQSSREPPASLSTAWPLYSCLLSFAALHFFLYH